MKLLNPTIAKFHAELVAAYTDLFANDPVYTYSASKCSPLELADKMLPHLAAGTASYHGKGIARAAKACGIKPTRKAVIALLDPLANRAPLVGATA